MSEPYSVVEGVVITRTNDDSIKSLDDLKGKTVGATITSNWAQISRDAGAKLAPVEGFTQAITLLNQGRVDAVVNDSIAFYLRVLRALRHGRCVLLADLPGALVQSKSP